MDLQRALNNEEEFWTEKSWLHWHCDADGKIKYASKSIFLEDAFKSMSILKCGDLIIDNQEGIEQHDLCYYSNIFLPICYVANDLINQVVVFFLISFFFANF